MTKSHLMRAKPVMMSSTIAVGEVILPRIAAQVRERKDRDGRLVGQAQPRRCNGGRRIRTVGGHSRSGITISAPRQRFDPARAVRQLLEYPPYRSDLNRQVAVLDGLRGPCRLDQGFLSDRLARALDEQREQCDRALAKRRRLGTVEEDSGLGVEAEGTKCQDRGHSRRHSRRGYDL